MTNLMMLAPVLSRTPSPISREVSASHFTIQFFVTWPTMIAPTGGSLLDAFSNILYLKRTGGRKSDQHLEHERAGARPSSGVA